MTTMPEKGPPWPECPNPELWTCWSYQGVECEVAAFLTALVVMLKPEVIVETGTYLGTATTHLAKGCEVNGFGHVFSQDVEPEMLRLARQALVKNQLLEWVTLRLGGDVEEMCEFYGLNAVDLAFIDADTPFAPTRAREVEVMRGYMSPRGVMLAHDTSPAWCREQVASVPGLTMIHLPTPRGLTIMRLP